MKPEVVKSLIVLNGLTQVKVAKELGIRPKTFNDKLNHRGQFTARQIAILVKLLRIDDPVSVFFAE